MVYHHPDKFCDHRYCDSGAIMFLMFLRLHMSKCLKCYVNILVDAPHGKSTALPCLVAIGLVQVEI